LAARVSLIPQSQQGNHHPPLGGMGLAR
jgi:hypothetical protein